MARIYSITPDVLVTGSSLPIYLTNLGYPGPFTAGEFVSTCQVSYEGASVEMFFLDMRLATENGSCVQQVEVSYSGSTMTWDCDSNTYFNVTKVTIASGIELSVRSWAMSPTGYLFIGLSGMCMIILNATRQ